MKGKVLKIPRRLQRSANGLFITVLLLLVWIYGYGLRENPLKWEEPRRCLIASEMIYRGDYVVPRVLGEIYLNKPPLQSWLIILLSGNRPSCVGPFTIRVLSVISLIGISCLLCVLWRPQKAIHGAWLPVFIFLTKGIMIQYGRSGELDSLFAFWICAAFTCFEIGRRRGAAWLQWFFSQTLLAAGILTKGIAPLFFYPPVFYCAWKDRHKIKFSKMAFFSGMAAELILVSAWVIPYASRSSVSSLGKRFAQEILLRSPLQQGGHEILAHFFSFPIEILVNTLPWAAILFLLLFRDVRKSVRHIRSSDSLFGFSLSVWLWASFLLWLMPGAKGRYMIPAYPFMAIVLAYILEAYQLLP